MPSQKRLKGRFVSEKQLNKVRATSKVGKITTAKECKNTNGYNVYEPNVRAVLGSQVNLGTEFSKVIVGYCDTLLLCKEKFPKKKSAGDLQLTTLVNEFLKIPFPNAHDAYADVCMLEQLTLSLFTNDKLIAEYFSFSTAISNLQNSLNSKKTEKTLAPLQKILSFYTIKRIASAGIDLDTLRQKFTEYGEAELVKFLQNARSTKGKPKKRGNFLPTKQINLIIRYLKE
ncbi:hypothetical protein PV328_011972 [Microctonus aethiopoides]|uniref:Exonuclease domain-containing protein n=1 Tax=Microctonus aethiopoides TaxID=144406 RepID=A0AA39C346_9HYME|nr:hypothetical protein PV328_011972 [Microctonus aethiopoides]